MRRRLAGIFVARFARMPARRRRTQEQLGLAFVQWLPDIKPNQSGFIHYGDVECFAVFYRASGLLPERPVYAVADAVGAGVRNFVAEQSHLEFCAVRSRTKIERGDEHATILADLIVDQIMDAAVRFQMRLP